MGFIKPIEKPSGMVFSYHRVMGISIMTNMQNSIEVMSYISKAKREAEIERLARMRAGDDSVMDEAPIFTDSAYIIAPYDPNMTVDSAYEYVLSLPEYEGAETESTEFTADLDERIEEIKEELKPDLPMEEQTEEPAEEGGE